MTLVETLRGFERIWDERPLVRRLYREWFELVGSRLAPDPGPTVEIGSGLGKLREVLPDVVLTDVEPTPWSDAVVDAEQLPYADASVANLISVDVFHHLPHPARFLGEAERVLRPGGRLVLVEPYCSPFSTLVYKSLHNEATDLSADPFADVPQSSGIALEANQALPTLAFFRRRAELERRWPGLRVVERRRFGFVEYPLSGGFQQRPLLPVALHRPLRILERALSPLAPLIAFRCLVVITREPA